MIKVFAEGRVAKDANVFEYGGRGGDRKTGVSFGLICDRFYNDENPTYIHCSIFGPGKEMAQHITMGKQLIVVGDLTRNKDGYYSLKVDQFSFGAKPMREQGGYGARQRRDDYDDSYQREPDEPPEYGTGPGAADYGFGEDQPF